MKLMTARSRIDALRAEDAPALFACRADPAVARFQGWRPADVAAATVFIDAQSAMNTDQPGGWLQRAIRLRADGTLIGDLGLNLPANDAEAMEFGISLMPPFQHCGYVREALRAVFDRVFAELGRHRIQASVDPRHAASIAMLRSLGMRQKAHHRESLCLRGEWVDDLVFAMPGREWPRHRG